MTATENLVQRLRAFPRTPDGHAAFGGPRTGASTARRHILAELQDFVCAFCGELLSETDSAEAHIIPRNGDNGYAEGNIAITHWECNNVMGKRDMTEFITLWARPDVIVTEWPNSFPRNYRAEFPKSKAETIAQQIGM